MLDVYKVATLPKAPPEVLGRRLLPLTLSAADLLCVFENPFEPFMGARDGTFPELVEAVILCTYKNREFAISQIQSGGFDWSCVELSTAAAAIPGFSLKAEVRKMSEYIAYWCRAPRRYEETHKPPPVPWTWALVQTLEEIRTISRAEVWELTVVDAMCQFWVYRAMHGDDSVMSEKLAREDEAGVEAAAEAARMKQEMDHGRNG